MQCKKCGKGLSGRQTSYCSLRCSRLHLKSLYRKRKPEKVAQWRNTYLAGKGKITPNQRMKAIQNNKNICLRCGSRENLEVHHIIPIRLGGTNVSKNLFVLCKDCHVLWHTRLGNYWER